MPRHLDRRQALTAMGSISLGALLTACGRGGSQNQATALGVMTFDVRSA